MRTHRPPTITNRSDMVGGVIHLLAEILALAVVLGVVTVIAWMMLLI